MWTSGPPVIDRKEDWNEECRKERNSLQRGCLNGKNVSEHGEVRTAQMVLNQHTTAKKISNSQCAERQENNIVYFPKTLLWGLFF